MIGSGILAQPSSLDLYLASPVNLCNFKDFFFPNFVLHFFGKISAPNISKKKLAHPELFHAILKLDLLLIC